MYQKQQQQKAKINNFRNLSKNTMTQASNIPILNIAFKQIKKNTTIVNQMRWKCSFQCHTF